MAAAAPFLAYLDELRALQGEAKVTNVYGDPAYSTTERVYNVYRSEVSGYVPGTSKEPNAARWPNHFLVDLHELDGTSTHVNLYLKYERLPGLEITAPHYDNALGTEGIKYTQRVAYGTPAKPAAALRIVSVGIANPGVVTVESQHDLPVGTFSLYIAGVKGSTPTITDGIYVATRTGAITFTIPVNVTGAATVNTGYASPLYNGQVIIDSTIENDQAVTSTLTTITALLPGRRTTGLTWASGGLRRKRTEQTTYHGTGLTGGTNIEKEEVGVIDTAQARLVTETLVDANGTALADGDGEYTISIRDGRTRITIFTTFRIVAAGYTVPVENATFKTGKVLDSKTTPIEGSPNLLLEVDWYVALSLPRTANISLTYAFPGIFKKLQDWEALDNVPSIARRPWMGVDVDYIDPKTLTVTGREIIIYTEGANAYLPVPFKVISPGSGSRAYPFIRPNTIHEAIVTYYVHANGSIDTIENLEASSPNHYDPYDILVAQAGGEEWRGRIYEHRIVQVSEALSVLNFPPIYLEVGFSSEGAAGRVDLVKRMADLGWPHGTRLLAVSSNSGDTNLEITVTGRLTRRPGAHYEFEQEVMRLNATDATTAVKSVTSTWNNLYEIELDSAATGTVTISVPGQFNFGGILVIAAPAGGDTFTITHTNNATGVRKSKVYTWANPASVILIADDKASVSDSDYFTINARDGAVNFYFDVTGTGVAAGPALLGDDRNVLVDISDASIVTASDVYSAVCAVVYADVDASDADAWVVVQGVLGVDNLTIYDRFLGVRAAPSLTGLGGAWSLAAAGAGTATAARQVRVTYGEVVNYVPISTLVENTAAALYETLADIDAAIASGACSPETPELPYVDEASFSLHGAKVGIADAEGVDATWTLAQTGTALTLTTPTASGDDVTVAEFAPGDLAAYAEIDFWNPDLTESNLPSLLTGTTGAITLAGSGGLLIMKARGTPAVEVTYDVSVDGVAWVPGAVTIPHPKRLANSVVHNINVVVANESVAPNYVRLNYDNSDSTLPRAMHAFARIYIT